MRIFWPESFIGNINEKFIPAPVKIVFGMEMLAFDVTCEKVPFAGLCGCDPMDPVDVARADGALRSELERFGLSCEIEELDWRVAYESEGELTPRIQYLVNIRPKRRPI